MNESDAPRSLPKVESPPSPPRPRLLRRFFLRHLPLSLAGAAVLLAVVAVGVFYVVSSTLFENAVRKNLIARIQAATGGRVEIDSFHWRPLELEAEAGNIVIHGLEALGEAPYAAVQHLQVRISVLGFWSPRILLRDLEIERPQIHLIVYANGSTNQPRPRKPAKQRKPALDTFFDLQAGHVGIGQGELDYENRAAAFDFQNRLAPLDLDARDVSLQLAYAAAALGKPESYRIEAAATDLSLFRNARPMAQTAQGKVKATVDLVRGAAYLRSLRLSAGGHDLVVSGALEDFADPTWQATAVGELDMRLLDPITGYPFAPQGIAHLDLAGTGHTGLFRADGSVHVEGGSYIGTGVVATGVGLDAHVHADPQQLLITSIVARLRQGGQLEGEVALDHWLPPIPGGAVMQPASPPRGRSNGAKSRAQVQADIIVIPVNGKVTAEFKGVSLDAVLDMVGQPPFQRLGLDARVTGPAVATWTKGDYRTLAVTAKLAMNPSADGVPGEVPSSGAIDGT